MCDVGCAPKEGEGWVLSERVTVAAPCRVCVCVRVCAGRQAVHLRRENA